MTTQTHPMILVAATSVTVASLAAAAYFTGILPQRGETPAEPPAVVAAAPNSGSPETPAKIEQPAATHAKPAAKSAPEKLKPKAGPADVAQNGTRPAAMQHTRDTPPPPATTGDTGIDVIPSQRTARDGSSQPVERAAAVCAVCGTVDSVREIATEGEGTGLGAVAGGVLGGLLGHQIGKGSGRDLGTIAGAVGGAFAGHQVEKRVRSGKQVDVTVRMDDGSYRTIEREVAGRWRQGDRVRVEQGRLQAE